MMEDNRVSNKELLVIWSNKRYRKTYREMWYMSENKEQDKSTGRKVEAK